MHGNDWKTKLVNELLDYNERIVVAGFSNQESFFRNQGGEMLYARCVGLALKT